MEGRGGQVRRSGQAGREPRGRPVQAGPGLEEAAAGDRARRRVRILVAILLGEAVGWQVEGLRRSLGDPALARIGAHVTLVPPVDVPPEQLADAAAVVERAAGASEPFVAQVGPVRTFAPVNPVVYLAWSELTDRDAWPATEALRDRLLNGPLDRPASRRRPFVPHVTISRRMASGDIPAAVELLSGFRSEVDVTELAVLEWTEAGRWAVRSTVPLGGRRAVGRGGVEVTAVVHWVGDAPPGLPWTGAEARARRLLLLLRPEGAVRAWAAGSDEPVALLDGLIGARTFVVLDLDVRPALRGMGLGRRVAMEAEAVARAEGCDSVELAPFLAARLGDAAAQALGFRPELPAAVRYRRDLVP